jgi:hypothetical protein
MRHERHPSSNKEKETDVNLDVNSLVSPATGALEPPLTGGSQTLVSIFCLVGSCAFSTDLS